MRPGRPPGQPSLDHVDYGRERVCRADFGVMIEMRKTAAIVGMRNGHIAFVVGKITFIDRMFIKTTNGGRSHHGNGFGGCSGSKRLYRDPPRATPDSRSFVAVRNGSRHFIP